MKKGVIITIVLIVVVLVIILAIRLFSNEDDWICDNRQWVKHGNPKDPMPTKPCGGLIGGQRDEHGCLTPAGYSWNATEQECVKEWEKGEQRYQVTNFETCKDAGYPIMESYPQQCATPSGRTFTEIPEEQKCEADADCIPLPSECHPLSCINKKFESNYKKPEACTMMFSENAAYKPEDCACEEGACVNKNKCINNVCVEVES
ncbi:hypothetical protein CO154_02305 [Candidatus Pacearchaeota archaeon CG_4_9_14_3_um_filter_31_7]|nr:MAG: hypothetical protein AUJ10_02125 [Candidatus Pacearchaeota archaeon CG1_02_31_27]PIN92146.1 MAG: hypothetical protein COU55_02120 [Candidatus Pacearchaeota archaeon CG10_big_fil_rev_8_21_14_0_10_31_59]PIZ80778.1 MAG: hypothetical protein COX99_01685 [Candidatus Pacearchaeota archaeon CG_4_10_14_0_2_um_filter_31_10]PJA70544.1 MAG: hypothetical protein CO154_02305 [Candidatus Pacearchaeota archaeon CG_4_9_14_3_um_filter_31_7]